MLFSSLPVFLSVFIPLSLLGLVGIIFEDRLVKFEQRIFRQIKRKLRSKKRKAAACSKQYRPARGVSQKREQLRRVA